MLAPGDTIDRYRVIREIGHGGMAVVYLVEHTTLDTRHALKVLTQTSQMIRERLIMEGRVQAKLKHANLVAVTDVLDVEGNPGLLMEFVDGPSLREWLRDQPTNLETAASMFRGIVSGVARAHEAGVIHRDLKPGNVLLDAHDNMTPKVADFGLAKALQSETPSLHQTRSGMAMGTPSYMAPEQIRDAKTVDGRADIFALGCILYDLVCGQQAFRGRDMLDIMNRVSGGLYTPAQELVPDLPDALNAAINGCLEPKRRMRIPNCGVLLRVLDGEDWAPAQIDEFDPNSTFPSLDPAEMAAAQAAGHSAELSGETLALGPHGVGAVEADARPVTVPPVSFQSGGSETISLPPGSLTSFDPASDSALHSSPEWVSLQRRNRILSFGMVSFIAIGLALVVVAVGAWLLWGRAPMDDDAVRPPETVVTPSGPEVVPSGVEASGVPPSKAKVEVPETEGVEGVPEVDVPERVEPPPMDAEPPEGSPTETPPDPPPIETPPPEVRAVGRVGFTGADAIRLIGSSGTYGAGEVPVGTYSIEARFGARVVTAGRIRVTEGDRVMIRCDRDFEMCNQ